jgi:hypothetical protein
LRWHEASERGPRRRLEQPDLRADDLVHDAVDQLAERVAGQHLGTAVRVDDPPVGGRDDEALGGRFDQATGVEQRAERLARVAGRASDIDGHACGLPVPVLLEASGVGARA